MWGVIGPRKLNIDSEFEEGCWRFRGLVICWQFGRWYFPSVSEVGVNGGENKLKFFEDGVNVGGKGHSHIASI